MTLQVTRERDPGRERTVASHRDGDDLRRIFVDLIRLCTTSAPQAGQHHAPESTDQVLYEVEIAGELYYMARSQVAPINQINLSPRERAIAQLIAKGLPNKTIGDMLEISPWTVATHLRRIFVKLDVTSRAAMVARLIENGLL